MTAANPLWCKDAVIYQLHVRSFCDSNGDGIGDFPGLTQKLDYVQGLGVDAVWQRRLLGPPGGAHHPIGG